jgi:RNA 2',3'-cyclic 3'-phosphodiesterase
LDDTKNIRAFLAIEPPEKILAEISRLQEKLKREISGKLSWTRPQGNHLTLKFFGGISAADAENIGKAVKKQAAGMAPLLLKVEKMGVFPDWRRPRVLWLGITGDTEGLTSLQNKLEEDFEGLGFPRENRPFRAHFTLARIKIPQSAAGLEAAAKKSADFSAGEFSATELVLFQSKLTPQGAIYTRLTTVPLGGEK